MGNIDNHQINPERAAEFTKRFTEAGERQRQEVNKILGDTRQSADYWRERYELSQGELEDAQVELNLARAELERLKEILHPSKERPNTCPPREIFLNICDEPDMPPLDEIDWSEVTWSANNAATRQAIMYVDLAALFSMQDRALEAEKQLEHLRKDKARLDWLGQLLTLEPAAVDCVTLDCKDRGAVRIDRSMSGRGVVAKGHLRAAIDAAMEEEQ